MRDRHVDVVDDDRQVIGRMPVRPQDDEVLDVRAVELDPPVHRIVKRRGAGRHLEADRARRARRFELGDLARATARRQRAVVLPGLAARLGALALLAQPSAEQ